MNRHFALLCSCLIASLADAGAANGADDSNSVNVLVLARQLNQEGGSSVNRDANVGNEGAKDMNDAGHLSMPASRSVREIEGWKVKVDDRLLEESPDRETGRRALRFLEAKLVEIVAVVPADRLKDLRDVTIVLDLNCGNLASMQYHPSASWLKANGYSVDLEKCVHIPRAADLPTRRNINEQPWAVLHELAHAFHDQKLDFNESRVLSAYEKFKQSGHGDATLLYNGNRVKHYALTNQMEFFAEMTEAYFGANDFFPFNRAELQEAEPDLFQLFTEIWGPPVK